MAKVLLVEDDNNLREIYEARLQAEGYDIVSAMDGEEALVVAKKEKPDLVISDVMMPRISGFEMLDILRNTDGLKDVKVIMLTALGQAEDKTRADSLGADRYLVKSQVTLEDIVKAAQELLGPADPPAAATPVTAAAGVAATPSASIPAPSTTPAQVAPVPEPVAASAPPATTPEPAQATSGSVPAPGPVAMSPGGTPQTTPAPSIPVVAPEPSQPVVPPPAGPNPTPPQEPSTPVQPPAVPAASQPAAPSVPTAPEPAQDAVPAQPTEAQTTSHEEDAIKAQIESFVSQNNQTAPGLTPSSTPEQAPAPNADGEAKPGTAPETPEKPNNHDFMADAIKGLVSDAESEAGQKPQSETGEKTIQPPTHPDGDSKDAQTTGTMPAPDVVTPSAAAGSQTTPPAAEEAPVNESDDDNVGVAHKKIISPITDATGTHQPDLNDLLAKEGFGGIDEMHQEGYGTPTPQNPTGLPAAPHPPGHVISPNPQGQGGVDPNSIAL
ncbi:MAG TPA: response regulator [Candidatus Saccharimonadales bacterium]|nr:response regulator [Candidatus Saccharimonadales bacterium]